ncbi:rCG50192 [Rattus norvegicus]|uniref:RCG50192 n=1 Tax=Rattus norvegicus TaxID=10116 RepID=A6JZJ8_RAT|nr:rCG50192 [Rattus norvegicus]
MMVMDQTSEL